MKTILSACILLLILSASNIPAYCQGDTLVNEEMTIDGNVASVDMVNSRITIKSSETITFYVPTKAKIINTDGFDMQLMDVRVGNYVTVDYHDDKYGKHVMDDMEVEYIR